MMEMVPKLSAGETFRSLRRLAYTDQRRLRSVLSQLNCQLFASERSVRKYLNECVADAGQIVSKIQILRKNGCDANVVVTQAESPSKVPLE